MSEDAWIERVDPETGRLVRTERRETVADTAPRPTRRFCAEPPRFADASAAYEPAHDAALAALRVLLDEFAVLDAQRLAAIASRTSLCSYVTPELAMAILAGRAALRELGR